MNLLFVELSSQYAKDLSNELERSSFQIRHFTITQNQGKKREGGIFAAHLFRSEALQEHYGSYFRALDKNIVEFFLPIERDFMMLTDRAMSVHQSFHARKQLFYDLIRFWIGFLEMEDIDCAYFPCTPHTPWELVLMKALERLDIPFCYLSHTAINNRSLFRHSYHHIEKVPADFLVNIKDTEALKKEIDPELLKDFKEESIVTNVIKLENDVFQKQADTNSDTNKYGSFYKNDQDTALHHLMREGKEALRSVLEFLNIKERPQRLACAMDVSHPFFYWEKATLKHWLHARRLRKSYEKLSKDFDLSQPYIYFPMHLQPELTTQPEGGIFEDHYLALEQLLQALPKGWKILIKENPRQFDISINKVSGMTYRDISDYQNMLSHNSVVLVPQSIKSEELITKAEITATITGTAGWEALNLGKVCMTFARPWYSACQSCCIVECASDITKALDMAKTKTEKDIFNDLLKYLAYYQPYLKIATLHAPSDVSFNSRPYDEIIENHVVALKAYFQQRGGTRLRFSAGFEKH